MTQTELFKKLGAPLASVGRSWGAIRPSDGAVFLRVWQDRKQKLDGCWYMRLTDREADRHETTSFGLQERLKHVELVRQGAPCYLVMCLAKDPDATPRETQSFNSREVFVGGEVVEIEGDFWVQIAERVSIRSVLEES